MNALSRSDRRLKCRRSERKLIFTILMLVIFRLGCCIPVPNIDRAVLSDYFGHASGLFGLFDMFSGGSFSIFDLCSEHYAVRNGIDYSSVTDRGLSLVSKALFKEGTEGLKEKSHSIPVQISYDGYWRWFSLSV